MVHFPEFALSVLCIQTEVIGFPHSEINGSQDDYSLPLLIAVFHVLHRLEAPRHSPFALSSLTIKFIYNFTIFNFKLDFITNLYFTVKFSKN
jgi:hypothetical protein